MNQPTEDEIKKFYSDNESLSDEELVDAYFSILIRDVATACTVALKEAGFSESTIIKRQENAEYAIQFVRLIGNMLFERGIDPYKFHSGKKERLNVLHNSI